MWRHITKMSAHITQISQFSKINLYTTATLTSFLNDITTIQLNNINNYDQVAATQACIVFKMFFFKKLIMQQGHVKLAKPKGKTHYKRLTFQINCSFELSINQRILKNK